MFLVQMPAARTHHQDRKVFFVQDVVLAAVRCHPVQIAGNGFAQRALAGQQIFPSRRSRVLEIGHINFGARVQRINHHLGLHRAGNLNPTIEQVGRQFGDFPLAFANCTGVFPEVWGCASIELRLTFLPCLQTFLPRWFKAMMQFA